MELKFDCNLKVNLKNIEKCLNAARKASKKSDYDGNKISRHMGCCAACKRRILTCGYNTNKTHPWQEKYNQLRFDCKLSPAKMHAEMMTLIKAIRMGVDPRKLDFYIYREKEGGKLACSKPCESCMAILKKYGVRKIFYFTEDGKCVCEKL